MDSENNLGTQNTQRFTHLLQPIRDLAENWNIDVASELEEYLQEVCGCVNDAIIDLSGRSRESRRCSLERLSLSLPKKKRKKKKEKKTPPISVGCFVSKLRYLSFDSYSTILH